MEKKKKVYNILSIVILVSMFIFMATQVARQSFWGDELDWTIRYLEMPNIITMLKELAHGLYNLPLFYVFMYPIYRIVPFGEIWLLLPNMFAVVIGLYFIKKSGDLIGGEDLGFISLVLGATSYALIYQCASEFRPYAFLFMFSCLALYLFLIRLREKSRKNTVFFIIALLGLAYSHWFGCLIIPFYFLIEGFLWLRKKTKLTFIIPYLVAGGTFLPWFIICFLKHSNSMTEYFGLLPAFKEVVDVIANLTSYNKISFILFVLGFLGIILYLIFTKKDKNYLYLIVIGAIIWAIGIIFIYSRFINPGGSLFVNRYFFVIIPHLFIVSAFSLSLLLKINIPKNKWPINIIIFFVIICPLLIIIGYQNYKGVISRLGTYFEPFREVSQTIADNEKAYDKTSAVIDSMGTTYLDYYFKKQGLKLPNAVYLNFDGSMSQKVKDDKIIYDYMKATNEDLLVYDTLFIFKSRREFDQDFLKFIDEHYEIIKKYPDISLNIYEKKAD